MILGSSTDTPKNEMRDRRKLIQCFKKNLAFAICRSPIITPPTPPPPLAIFCITFFFIILGIIVVCREIKTMLVHWGPDKQGVLWEMCRW